LFTALSVPSLAHAHHCAHAIPNRYPSLLQLAHTLTAALRDATQQGDRARRKADMKQQFEVMRQAVQAEVDEHCLYWDAGLRFGRIAQWVPDAKLVPEHPFPTGSEGDTARALWEEWGLGERDGVFDSATGDVDDDDDDDEEAASGAATGAATEVDAALEDAEDAAGGEAAHAVMSSCMPLLFTQWSRARRACIGRALVADARNFVDAIEELASTTEFEWLLREGPFFIPFFV
jgi:hypothetical protein